MTSDKDTESRLGHDPLEWLEEEEEEDQGWGLFEDDPDTASAEQAPAASDSEIAEQDNSEATEVEVQAESKASETMSSTQPSSGAGNGIITLPERITVHVIEELHSEWKSAVSSGSESMVIESSQLSEVDAAGVQLLYLLVKELSYKGCDVTLINISDEMKVMLGLSGLNSFFEKHIDAA